MKIKINKIGGFAIKVLCVICDERFTMDIAQAFAYDNKSEEMGPVCPTCLKLGSKLMEKKLFETAIHYQKVSERLKTEFANLRK